MVLLLSRRSTFSYFTGPYGECSATCGTAVQTRVVQCRDENGATVEDSSCSETKPDTQRICTGLPACPTQNTYSIFAGAFSQVRLLRTSAEISLEFFCTLKTSCSDALNAKTWGKENKGAIGSMQIAR